MRYGSVCSGIEAATMAWHPLGWEPSFFSEIEAFPSAVLNHHYPSVPNLGDMTKFEEWPDHAIDLLVGGTPCQSFSVAGLRQGLADPRGNLMLTYLAIARRYQPRWLVWENVPGVLSSNGGRDFGTLIRGLEECGYHAAWRVLDAQFVRVDGFERAVPQRRRRVFVVGYLGDWRRAAAVLLEPEGMRGDTAPRRLQGQGTTGRTLLGALDGEFNPTGNVSGPITTGAAHTNRSSVVAFAQNTRDEVRLFGGDGQTVGALAAEPGMKQQSYVAQAFNWQSGGDCRGLDLNEVTMALTKEQTPAMDHGWTVRRLTPTECERLQGFPDDFTAIPYRNKLAADGPRYKALGNSMAVNVMRWIGQRIQQVENLQELRQ